MTDSNSTPPNGSASQVDPVAVSQAAAAKSPGTGTASNAPVAPAVPSIALRGIGQRYPSEKDDGEVIVVEGVNLTLDGAAINMLLGPSGCGKSTLLRMMGGVPPPGVDFPSEGEVLIDGVPSVGAHDDVVMVFQRYANRPDLTVRENVAFPFRMRLWRDRIPVAEQRQRVEHIIEAVGLADHAGLRPASLSGGQNQRVALARALVLRPRVLLMDEPFGALDAQTREDMQQLLVRLWSEQRCAIVFVTHDVTEALTLGDRVIVLSSGPARVADDFEITEPRPRSAVWLRSTGAVALKNRILDLLQASSARGQVRMSV